MKKIVLLTLFTLAISIAFTSCKSKEEQFIGDMKSLTEKMEKADGMFELGAITLKASKDMAEKYGKDWEHFDNNGMNFTPEQKAELEDLQKRMTLAAGKSTASGLDGLKKGLDSMGGMVDDLDKMTDKAKDLLGDGDNADEQE